jgi:phytoene synthase
MSVQTVSDAQLALTKADSLLRTKGRSFHWARYLLGKVHADRATRLYGFCRYIDDLVDEAPSALLARAQLSELSTALITGQSDDPSVIDALALMQECHIDPALLLELIAGVASDLETVLLEDDTALLRYCYRVAGTVGLMMCQVLDVRDEAALRHAVDLGVAMQLTNICRDVAHDATLGRRYLPASRIGELTPYDLIDPDAALQPLLRQCVADLLTLAGRYYHSGELGLPYLPFKARGAILVAARVYGAIGSRLRSAGFAYWQQRAVVPAGTKAVLTAQALLELVSNRALRRGATTQQQVPHELALHDAFADLPYAVPRAERSHDRTL